jgi:3-deoxy-D-manno-octulosonic-acid transferase
VTLPLRLWHGLTCTGAPLINALLRHRVRHGKEIAARLPERQGIAALPRPEGRLLWCHGASVGEALSALPLLTRFLAESPGWHALMTTGTVTSAHLLAERLPERAFHQFVPIDHPRWVARFLEHWRPDAGVWLESDLWPNLLMAAEARRIPLLLTNARLSATSFRRWQRLPQTARRLLGVFQTILAQDDLAASRFATLAGHPVTAPGNLKDDAPPLPCDPAALAGLTEAAAGRPLWLAASTHPGEDAVILAAHARLSQQQPDILTVIVPRHPHRGAEIAADARRSGLAVAQRSLAEPLTPETAVYIADTMGELGLFYRLAGVAFVGGSLVQHGGQNILEPALLDTAILHGPHLFNFTDILATFTDHGASRTVSDAATLADAVAFFLDTPAERDKMATAARQAAASRQGATDKTLAVLRGLLQSAKL